MDTQDVNRGGMANVADSARKLLARWPDATLVEAQAKLVEAQRLLASDAERAKAEVLEAHAKLIEAQKQIAALKAEVKALTETAATAKTAALVKRHAGAKVRRR